MSLKNAFEDLATDKGLTLLRRIFQLLKPLGVVSGGGSNRLSVDINTITTLPTLAAVTTVTTVGSVTTVGTVSNQTNMGGVNAFEMMKSLSRSAYNTGVRANIT